MFLKESTNLSDGPFYSSHRQMGIKQPASQSARLLTESSSLMTDFQNKLLSKFFRGDLNVKKEKEEEEAAFDLESIPKFIAHKKNPD